MDSLLCERRTYEDTPFSHAHSYSQLIIPIHGSLTISAGQTIKEEGQDVILIPSALHHSFYAESSNQFFVFDIPSFYWPNRLAGNIRCYSFDERWQAIRSLLFAEVGHRPAANERLVDLFRYIAGVLQEERQSPSVAYIKEHFYQPLTIQQLADLEHFNPTYYVEWFKQQYGKSPMAYIRELRLAMAQELLTNTGYTLLQIAQQIGYANQETLTRLFRKEIGITPGEYRKKYRS